MAEYQERHGTEPTNDAPLWQQAQQELDHDLPEWQLGKRFYELWRSIEASVGVDCEPWEELDTQDRWVAGKAAVAFKKSLEDDEAVDSKSVKYNHYMRGSFDEPA